MKSSHFPRRGKRIRALLPALLLLLLCMVVPAAANPPANMTLSYDPELSLLSVTVTHPVGNITGHFIKDVTLNVNGNVVNDSVYTGQPSDIFTYTYPLVLKPGETVEATASCSVFGSATRSYTLPATGAAGPVSSAVPQAPSATKSPVALAAILAGVAGGFMIRKRS